MAEPRPVSTPAEQAFADGALHQAAGRTEQAAACFRLAIRHWPQCAAAWANLGMLLEDQGQAAEAERHYRQALALDATLYPATMNLASLLASLKRFDEAERSYQQAIALQPQQPAAWSNLGAMLACLRRDADAEACCRHALVLDPAYDKARFNLSYLYLRQGRLAEGWLCNEARESTTALQARLPMPRWAGDALAGRSLLIVSDAGHGDLIQMARYAHQLKALGAGRLVLMGQPALKRLLRQSALFDEVLGYDEPMPTAGIDAWAPMMSLPYLCGTGLGSIPASLPYLQADTARVAHRAAQMRAGFGEPGQAAGAAPGSGGLLVALRVGLVWQGNPLHENDSERSLPSLALLAPLGRIPGVQFISLQSGAGQDAALTPPPGLHFTPLAEPLGDFAETAAVVANLDLVIGIDSSAIHLAGALGKPVWVMLPAYKTDWRWLDGRADSPWYPGVMRLFRQPQMGDWASVVAQVSEALAAWSVAAQAGAGEVSCPY